MIAWMSVVSKQLNPHDRFFTLEPIQYPLVNVYITMENHHFQWVNPLQMAIFNNYVSLPEGNVGIFSDSLEVWGAVRCPFIIPNPQNSDVFLVFFNGFHVCLDGLWVHWSMGPLVWSPHFRCRGLFSFHQPPVIKAWGNPIFFLENHKWGFLNALFFCFPRRVILWKLKQRRFL